ADIAETGAGADDLDALVEAFLSDAAQSFGPFGNLADHEHPAGVAVVAVLDHGDVDIEDVAILQWLVIRDAMADHVVDRSADGFGKALVVERCRNWLLDRK